jgi:hypothetical protein
LPLIILTSFFAKIRPRSKSKPYVGRQITAPYPHPKWSDPASLRLTEGYSIRIVGHGGMKFLVTPEGVFDMFRKPHGKF